MAPGFQNIPVHLAIIMDGNGRWAEQRGLKRSEGHRAGAESVRATLTAAEKFGIECLTLYTFSTENWGRPQDEVNGLFELLGHYLDTEIDPLLRKGVRFLAIGDLASLPEPTRRALKTAVELTAANTRLTLTLALSYGSRDELTRAARLLALEAAQGRRDPAAIDQAALESRLWTTGLPDPDLLIRTGGDLRLSNFLLWQCAYAELFFTETLWPDFREADLAEAIASYQNRQRRFGLTNAQCKGVQP